jgi:hypothetical protein
MSYQTALTNHTPFAADKFVLTTPEGQEAVLIVVAATFQAQESGALDLVAEQAPVRIVDDFFGAPGESSLSFDSEISLSKPCVDLTVTGTAYAPGGRPAERFSIEVDAGDIRKKLAVSGPRFWVGKSPSRAVEVSSVPLRYERAFGGVHPRTGELFDRNPVGLGFGKAVSREDGRSELPQIEYPNALMGDPDERPAPAGLSPIARSWQPRARLAGTYDDAWLARRWPLLPTDFDPHHNQAAPLDQQSTTLAGGQSVRLLNLTPEGLWQFRLPVLSTPVQLLYDDGPRHASPQLDGVAIEADAKRVRMITRLALRVDRSRPRLREVVIGNMTQSWLRARAARKVYLDFGKTQGVDPSVPCYRL